MEFVPAVVIGEIGGDRPGRAFGGGVAIDGFELGADEAGVDGPEGVAEEVTGLAIENAFGLGVDVGEAPVFVEGEEGVGDAFEDDLGLCFGVFSGGDVGDGADEVDDAAVGTFAIEGGFAVGFDPAFEAVAVDAVLDGVGAWVGGVDGGFDGGPDAGAVVGVDTVHGDAVVGGESFEAEDSAEAFVPEGDVGRGIEMPPAHVSGV